MNTARRITRDFRQLRELAALQTLKIAALRGVLAYSNSLLEQMMNDMDALVAKITELADDETQFVEQQKAIKAALQAHIDDLQKQVDANQPIDTTAAIAQVQAIIDAIKPPTPPAQTGSSDATGQTT